VANHVFYSLAVRKHMLKEGKEATPGSHTLWSYVASMLCTFASRIALAVLWTWPTSGVPNLLEKLPANLRDATIAWAIVNVAPADWIRRYFGSGRAGTAGRALLHGVAGFNKHASLRKTLNRAAGLAVGPRLALGAAVGAAAPLFKRLTDRVVASEPTPWSAATVAVGKEYLRALCTHSAITAAASGGVLVRIGERLRCGVVDYGVPWLDANVCVPRRWGLDDVVPRAAHAVVLFYLARLYVKRGLAPTTWGRDGGVVEARTRTRATPKATRRSARVRSRKTKGD